MPFFSASGISPYNKTSGGAAAPLPDASAYVIAAGITDPAEQAAANQFVLDLSGRGSTTNNTNQWSKHYALYPMSPTSLTAAAYNIKDPTEYKITWYNNPTHSLNGVSGNGVDQYGDTNFNLANDTASLNISIGAWISANNTLAQADMGAQNSSSPNSGAMLFPYNAGTHDASTVGEYTGGTTPMSTDRDDFMLVQNNGTNLQKFRNGVSYYNAPQALGTADSNNTFILARNLNGANALSSKGTSFNNISEHLTQNEITDLYDAMNTYNVSMSRSWIPFEFGNALQFDGVDDYVSMTPITESSTWFLSFWINGITNTGSYMYLFGFDAASGTRGGIGISLGGTAFGLSFGGLYYYNGSGITDLNVSINPSSWNHVAINATPTGLEVSLNGGTSVNTSASVPSNSLNQIGTLDLSSFGQIIYDEIGFLSGSNGTPQNITDLYNGGNGESFTTVMGANNLNLHLNESGIDTIAIDSGGSGNDGTLNNFPTSGMWIPHTSIPFKMTVDTTQAGSASDTFVLPFSSIGSYNCVVDWGDSTSSTITTYNDAALTHVYSTPGTYQISISGSFGGLYFNNSGDKLKLSSIDQWGNNVFTSMANAFYGCSNMTGNFTDYPNLGTITSLKDTFRAATLFNGDISSWDVSNVTVFNTMFYQATNFNSNIDSWNLKSTGSITMNNMFQFCTNFNQPLNSWNVSRVISFYETFANCPAFNQNLNSWDVSNATTMYRMFLSCTNFGLSGIGGDISSWTPTSCTVMERMLQSASNFNSDISGWNVSSVTTMRVMLYATTAFDQNIGSWNISNVTDFNDFMGLQTPSTFSASNLDAIYNGWDSRAVQTPIVITFGSAKHTAASSAARASLVSKGWTITDGGI